MCTWIARTLKTPNVTSHKETTPPTTTTFPINYFPITTSLLTNHSPIIPSITTYIHPHLLQPPWSLTISPTTTTLPTISSNHTTDHYLASHNHSVHHNNTTYQPPPTPQPSCPISPKSAGTCSLSGLRSSRGIPGWPEELQWRSGNIQHWQTGRQYYPFQIPVFQISSGKSYYPRWPRSPLLKEFLQPAKKK